MSFGRAQVELEAQCPINVGLKLAVVGGVEEVCYNAAKKDFSFTIENGVNIKVEGLIVNIIGTQKAETFELNDAKSKKISMEEADLNSYKDIHPDNYQLQDFLEP